MLATDQPDSTATRSVRKKRARLTTKRSSSIRLCLATAIQNVRNYPFALVMICGIAAAANYIVEITPNGLRFVPAEQGAAEPTTDHPRPCLDGEGGQTAADVAHARLGHRANGPVILRLLPEGPGTEINEEALHADSPCGA